MRCRQLVHVLFLVALDADDELDVFEAGDGRSVRASRECQELLALVIIEVIQDYFPEPLNELVLLVQWLHVASHGFQQIEVEHFRSADELF